MPISDTLPQNRPLRFCITGKTLTVRHELIAEIKRAGHRFVDHVSSSTDLLIMADPQSGSKKKRDANDLGVRCISEKTMRKIFENREGFFDKQTGIYVMPTFQRGTDDDWEARLARENGLVAERPIEPARKAAATTRLQTRTIR